MSTSQTASNSGNPFIFPYSKSLFRCLDVPVQKSFFGLPLTQSSDSIKIVGYSPKKPAATPKLVNWLCFFLVFLGEQPYNIDEFSHVLRFHPLPLFAQATTWTNDTGLRYGSSGFKLVPTSLKYRCHGY